VNVTTCRRKACKEELMLDPKQFVTRLLAAGIATPREIIGCSADEIAALEAFHGIKLPLAYTDFLRVAGRCAGKFIYDVDFLYDKLFTLNALAADLLNDWEKGQLKLPTNAFVFAMRYGEQFMFFEADGKNDDPPVFFYFEGHKKFKHIANSVWEVLEAELTETEHCIKR
jgi:hypothetical protein